MTLLRNIVHSGEGDDFILGKLEVVEIPGCCLVAVLGFGAVGRLGISRDAHQPD